VLLPSTTARLVLSGKYAEAKDPSALLAQMARDLETRKQRLGMRELQQMMLEAQRQGDRDRARKIAMLVEALRKGDRELADQLMAEISSNKKAE
jgi:DNA-binding GntR family transcriptional regulator